MKLKIYRGCKEIGGSLIEIASNEARILFDVGFPLFLNGAPIDKDIGKMSVEELLNLGVLPDIKGLYYWEDNVEFDAIIISHAHMDHYGLLEFIHRDIPIHVSRGTKQLLDLTYLFIRNQLTDFKYVEFKMYEKFEIADLSIKPYLMDHSAFDAASFEIKCGDKVIVYSGDFRGHGRKPICLDRFVASVSNKVDVLLLEGTMVSRGDEQVLTETELENQVVKLVKNKEGPVLVQCSSQNIDRIVTFYRVAIRTGRLFVVDVYTANVLHSLGQLENKIPYPSKEYANIKVFYPYRLTRKIFDIIGEEYAYRFTRYKISKDSLKIKQNEIIMMVRPSMLRDIEPCDFVSGVFIYSLWKGYRSDAYQQKFEQQLLNNNFESHFYHTSGHASISDLNKVVECLKPDRIIPIHTMAPLEYQNMFQNVLVLKDGEELTL